MSGIRKQLALWIMAVPALAAPGAWGAEPYPAKPIRFLVGFPPGGANDLVARAMAARLAPRLGSVASLAMGPAMYRELPFDPLNDFAPVTQAVGVSSLIVVHPSLPARSVKALVALAKRQPGGLNFGTPGTGSIAHLAAELFLRTAGIKMVHIPYKGGGPALIDALSGQIECLISLISTSGPHVKSGKLHGLAVTSADRSPSLPDVPTVAEAGYAGYEASGWLGLLFPAKTPDAVVARVHQESVAVLNLPEVRRQLQDVGLDPAPSGPEAFRAYIRAEHAKWGKLIREAGIRAE